ncbi:MAG: hypothetical protein WDN69_14930 [Aliidongia sp.]
MAKADNTHFSGPAAGAVDAGNGHLFIADTGNHRVQVLDTGSLAVVATIGTAGVAGSGRCPSGRTPRRRLRSGDRPYPGRR